MFLFSFSLAAVASHEFCHAVPAAKSSPVLAPPKMQVLAARPVLVDLPRSSADGHTWTMSAWRHEPLPEEDNFPERSSVHLVMAGDAPSAAVPRWLSSLSPEQQHKVLVKPSWQDIDQCYLENTQICPILAAWCSGEKGDLQPCKTALGVSPARTARMTSFCLCGVPLFSASTKGFARTDQIL